MLIETLSKKKRYQWGLLGIFILFSFVLYAPILNSYFIAEDLRHLAYGWDELRDEFFATGLSVGYRPASVLYIVLSNKLWGRDPLGHHAAIVVFHALNGWLVYLITARLLKNNIAAIIAALLFIGSPAQVEAVAWIAAAVGTVTSALICMSALWLWTKPGHDPNAITIGFVAFLYFIALLTKELSFPFLGILMVVDRLLGRRFIVWRMKEIIRSFLFYWPFYAALGLFILLYWSSGALGGAVAYGTPAGVSLLSFIARLSLSARFMFLPLSSLIDVGPDIGNLVWLLAFIILVGLSRARWTFALAVIALIPSLSFTAGRMTYLAMVGLSMGLASLLFDGIDGLSSRVNPKLMLPSLVSIITILLLVFGIDVYRESLSIIEGGGANWSIPRQVKEQVPELPSKSEIYIIGFPNEAVYRWGIVYELKYLYDDPTLSFYSVEDGQPEGLTDKISLTVIPCGSSEARFFFRYDADSNVLSMVDEKVFGLICP